VTAPGGNFRARRRYLGVMPIGLSELATGPVERKRDVEDRTIPVYGVAVHCTGSSLITKALTHGADCLEYAIAYYLRPDSYFAHYVVGFDGTIAQIADEHEHAMHIGLPAVDRQAYLLGTWKKKLPTKYVAAWTARWPQYKSPSHLYPGKSPNAAYVGIELLPWQAGCPGTPHGPALRYTTEQHDATAALVRDVATRWEFPDGWERTGRLACHEDISPLTRTNKVGGWDPGVVRAPTWFDWSYFVTQI